MMVLNKALQIAPHGDREIVMKRDFDAPRHLVFAAYTKPELVKRWLGGYGGWDLAVCEIDLRVGGRYRYVWRKASCEAAMTASGVYLEVAPPERIVCTESFEKAWYPGESQITTEFAEAGQATTVTTTLRYESTEGRDMVAKSPMESGLSAHFAQLDELLANLGGEQ